MKKKNKILITTGTILIAGGMLLGAYALNGSGILERTNDVTPPQGRIQIKGATETNNINYVDRTQIQVQIYAKDDTCTGDEIKYYISTSPITGKIEDSKWKSYYEGAVEKIDLPSLTSTNTIYAAFKDKWGNTSTIYTGDDTEYTITYDANGGINAPLAQKVQYGMPFYIASSKPSYEGKYFVGWSEVKGSTMADYEGVEIYKQNEKIGANIATTEKNITLYAVWTDEIDKLPLLADVVKVGDYVNYPVYYDNVLTYKGQSNITNLTGWRVLSVSGDTVNLISAGVPLSYYHYDNNETSIKNLLFNFLDIPFGTTENYTFRRTGFNAYETIKETFNNKYTDIYEKDTPEKYTCTYDDGTVVEYSVTKKAGELKVRTITKQDVDKVYDKTGKTETKTGTPVTDAKFEKLLALPVTDNTSRPYANYWLASAYNAYRLRDVIPDGSLEGGDYSERGVRPVVSLKSTVRTTGTDIIGAWDIEIK